MATTPGGLHAQPACSLPRLSGSDHRCLCPGAGTARRGLIGDSSPALQQLQTGPSGGPAGGPPPAASLVFQSPLTPCLGGLRRGVCLPGSSSAARTGLAPVLSLDGRILVGSWCGLQRKLGTKDPEEAGGLVPDREWGDTDRDGRLQQVSGPAPGSAGVRRVCQGGCSRGCGAWMLLSLGCTSPPGVLLNPPLRPDPRPQSCVLSLMKQGVLLRPRGFRRTEGGLGGGWLSEGRRAVGREAGTAPCSRCSRGQHACPLARSGPREGTQAGIFLVTAPLPFSSGSCQTEEIVSSEMNVLGKFVFPGKSCFLGPTRQFLLAWLFLMLFPALLLAPQTPLLPATDWPSCQSCSSPPKRVPAS